MNTSRSNLETKNYNWDIKRKESLPSWYQQRAGAAYMCDQSRIQETTAQERSQQCEGKLTAWY
jgi:hypothetical protein